MTIYLFDMDGTLTPARLPMEAEFASFFYKWQQKNSCFLVTGSDFKKVEEQLPKDIINSFIGVYSSMGNVLTAQDNMLYKKDFQPVQMLLEKLEGYRSATMYPYKLHPNYIEKRIGMINFSVLGRDCSYTDRDKYAAWDKINGERQKIAAELTTLFPEYDISIGGNISIDITPKGYGKEQVAYHLRKEYPYEKIIFLGDKTFPGGNDYALAQALRKLENTRIIQVASADEAVLFLKNITMNETNILP